MAQKRRQSLPRAKHPRKRSKKRSCKAKSQSTPMTLAKNRWRRNAAFPFGRQGGNLAEMAKIGLPVPRVLPSRRRCAPFYANKQSYPKVLEEQVRASVARTEKQLGKNWVTSRNLSCSQSAREPGFHARHDGYHLNLGLNDETVEALATPSETPASLGIATVASFKCTATPWVFRSCRGGARPIRTHNRLLRGAFPQKKARLTTTDLTFRKGTGFAFQSLGRKEREVISPRPWEQLWGSVGAVFGSWMNDRANVYRRKYGIPASWVLRNAQAMVLFRQEIRFRGRVYP